MKKTLRDNDTPSRFAHWKKEASLILLFAVIFWGTFQVAINCNCNSSVVEEPGATLEQENNSDDDSFTLDDSTPNNCTTKYPNKSPLNVLECEDIGADWECENELACDCGNDYFDFPNKASEYRIPISKTELQQQFENIANGNVEIITSFFSHEELKKIIRNILNNNFLRDGFNDRKLIVTTIEIIETEDYIEKVVLLKDPFIGVMKAILRKPKDNNPHPCIIAIPGHCSNSKHYLEKYFGEEYTRRGFSVIVPTMRGTCGGLEQEISLQLLLNGFSFQCIKDYEIQLVLKYLNYLENINNDSIGIIGHSGGSALLNHHIRTSNSFYKAGITDYTSNYGSYNSSINGLFDDSTPKLYPYYRLINDFTTSLVPVLQVPYGYKDHDTGESYMPQIFAFFDYHLKGK